MDAVLRQSKAVCPFLKQSSPAALRALSTSARPQIAAAAAAAAAPVTAVSSPCGGTMSKLQVLANRCPVMGKAMAVRSAQYSTSAKPAAAGMYAQQKRRLHGAKPHGAREADPAVFSTKETGMFV